jgi:hypothetical protein
MKLLKQLFHFFTFKLFHFLFLPVVIDFRVEHRERNIFDLSAAFAEFFDHSDRAVGVSRVNDNGRRAVCFFIIGQPAGDGVARMFIVGFAVVMMRQKIVIEKDRVVCILTQKFLRFGDRFGNVNLVAFESFLKPTVTAMIVIEQKNRNRRALGTQVRQAEFYHNTTYKAHKIFSERNIKYNTASANEKFITGVSIAFYKNFGLFNFCRFKIPN